MAEYQKAIVSYLDILGFRDLIRDSPVDQVLETLRTTKRKADFTVGMVNSNTFEAFTKKQNFSDLVVRTTPVDSENDLIPRVNMELMIVAGIQCQLAARGILLRGGVSFMDIYDQDGFIFGPALVRAYELAETVAVFPRLVIDSDLLDHSHAAQIWPPTTKRGDDGVRFVDYLTVCYKNFGGFTPTGFTAREDIIPAHKATVENNSAIQNLLAESPETSPTLLSQTIPNQSLQMAHPHTTT